MELNVDKVRNIENKISLIDNKLLSDIECPHCKQHFIVDSEESIEELEQKSSDYLLRVDRINNTNHSLRKEIKILKDKILDCEKNQESLEVAISDMKYRTKEITELQYEVDILKLKNDKLNEQINSQKNDSISIIIDNIKTKLNKKLANFQEYSKQLDIVNENIESKKRLLFHLSKGFKNYIVNFTLENIQSRINLNLEKYKSNFRVKISGWKQNKDGTIREKINVVICYNGSEYVYNNLSSGEKNRVDTCVNITFQELCNNDAEYGKGLDFMGLDEFLTNMDFEGQEMTMKILDQCGITNILVMHHIDSTNVRNKTEFIKYNDSTIIVQ